MELYLSNFSSYAYVREACGLEHGQSELLSLCHMITIHNRRDYVYKDVETKRFMVNGVAGL